MAAADLVETLQQSQLLWLFPEQASCSLNAGGVPVKNMTGQGFPDPVEEEEDDDDDNDEDAGHCCENMFRQLSGPQRQQLIRLAAASNPASVIFGLQMKVCVAARAAHTELAFTLPLYGELRLTMPPWVAAKVPTDCEDLKVTVQLDSRNGGAAPDAISGSLYIGDAKYAIWDFTTG